MNPSSVTGTTQNGLGRSRRFKILSGLGRTGELEEIIVGPVQGNGKDLPSGNFFGNYVNDKGRIDVLQFF